MLSRPTSGAADIRRRWTALARPGSVVIVRGCACAAAVAGAAICLALSGCGPAAPAPPRDYVFYPPLPQRPRIQFLRTLSSARDVEPPPSELERFVVGTAQEDADAKAIKRPYGVVLSGSKLHVCDTGAQRVATFDLEQRRFHTFGRVGALSLDSPINVTVAPDGRRFITDTKAGRIFVFDPVGRPVRTITHAGGITPCDVAWHEGELFVSDLKSGTVLVLDPATGELLRRIGTRGSKPGQMIWPTNIAFGPAGRLYVCDTLNARVQIFDAKGVLVGMIGSMGTALGKMVRPKGIAVDRESRLYVADSATNSVQIFDPNGQLLLMLGRTGQGPGDMDLPAKVYVSYEGVEHFAEYASPDFRIEYLVFVTNQFGPNKINVYGFGTYQGTVPARPAGRHRKEAPATMRTGKSPPTASGGFP